MLHQEMWNASRPYVWFSVIEWCLIAALCLMSLASCSPKLSPTQTPALPANLAQPCPALPSPPAPLIDPDRVIWEAVLIAMYGDCASRHRATVAAGAR